MVETAARQGENSEVLRKLLGGTVWATVVAVINEPTETPTGRVTLKFKTPALSVTAS